MCIFKCHKVHKWQKSRCYRRFTTIVTSPAAQAICGILGALCLFIGCYLIYALNWVLVEQGYLWNLQKKPQTIDDIAIGWCLAEFLGSMVFTLIFVFSWLITSETITYYKKEMNQYDLEAAAWSK